MKQVSEHKDFAEAMQALSDLQGEYDRLVLEHRAAYHEISNPSRIKNDLPVDEKARRMMAGKYQNETAGFAAQEVRDREFSLRLKIEEMFYVLRKLPERVEYFRVRAAKERRAELDSEFKQVHREFDEAMTMLQKAMRSEDALLHDMRMGGFGAQEPIVTAPWWINRDEALSHRTTGRSSLHNVK